MVNTRDLETISSYVYELDPLGNKTSVTEESGKVTEYTYNELNRLVQETVTYNGATKGHPKQ